MAGPVAAVAVLAVLFSAPTPASQYWTDQLGLSRAWQVSQGAGVTVGLVDTGVDARVPDLAGAVLPGAEFPDLGAGTTDAIGHGTTMALLIAGRGRDGGTTGVAPQSMILPARLNGGPSDAVDAIRWVVDHGAKVVNISLGSGGHTDAYDDGLRYAHDHDAVVVASAGNASQDRGVTSPADRPGVLAVSAVDRTGAFAAGVSVSGPEISFAAPGVDITTSRPGETSPTSGTSQAAAIVSGVVALVRARFPSLTADQVTEHLARTAKDLGTAGRDPLYGYGLIDPITALTTAPEPSIAAGSRGFLWWPWVLGLTVLCAGGWAAVRLTRRISAGAPRWNDQAVPGPAGREHRVVAEPVRLPRRGSAAGTTPAPRSTPHGPGRARRERHGGARD